MRILQNRLIISFISLLLFFISFKANAIDPFKSIDVTENFTTVVEFDQSELKQYSASDNLMLRVMDNNKPFREEPMIYKNGAWHWEKVMRFSEDLTFMVVKDKVVISEEYCNFS